MIRRAILSGVLTAFASSIYFLLDPPITLAAGEANSSAATWQMPWQISPISPVSEASGEKTVLSFVWGTGFVKGTPEALASIGRPLAGSPIPSRTLDTCRTTVWSEASKVGAKDIEAVPVAADKQDRKGHYFAPVLMRVTYVRPLALEVRQSMLICVVDRSGSIVDAYTPE
ncbi:hypothetical protein [Methylobacterium planeticum]|uniref:Uncharacterized protein n=1 Tax=Methylobacterium planeticum TaxID=2615211 RepID=A0A6N6MJX8_9HYPH|nr:hypothetical protein [Methylobacterium planeticum]KAB1069874.1 hypothetical protein F6X51_24455 [Methylobacterium planeticum]